VFTSIAEQHQQHDRRWPHWAGGGRAATQPGRQQPPRPPSRPDQRHARRGGPRGLGRNPQVRPGPGREGPRYGRGCSRRRFRFLGANRRRAPAGRPAPGRRTPRTRGGLGRGGAPSVQGGFGMGLAASRRARRLAGPTQGAADLAPGPRDARCTRGRGTGAAGPALGRAHSPAWLCVPSATSMSCPVPGVSRLKRGPCVLVRFLTDYGSRRAHMSSITDRYTREYGCPGPDSDLAAGGRGSQRPFRGYQASRGNPSTGTHRPGRFSSIPPLDSITRREAAGLD